MANKLIQDLTAGAFALTDLLEHQPIAGPPSLKGDVAALVTLLNTIYAPITGGAYVLKTGDTMSGLLTIAQATANTSALVSTGTSLTGANAQPIMNLSGTWNTTGTPDAFRLNITDTASDALSSLMTLQINGVDRFSFRKSGQLITVASILSGADLRVATGGYVYWLGRSTITSPADGVLRLTDAGETTFGRIQLGGTTSAFPAIKRSAALLQGRLADDSAYCDIEGRLLRTATAFTVATLPAAGTAGRRAYVTDALTPAFLTVVVGGGAVITPVFDNGTNWIGG